jgi:hypothetical protein
VFVGKAFLLRNRTSSLRARLAAVAAAGAVATTGGVMAATAASAAAYDGAKLPTNGPVSSDVAIAKAAKNSGLTGCRGVSTATWVAIALAESNGNNYAHATAIEDSRGLWQINLRSNSDVVGGRNLYDAQTNAWAANQICKRQGPTAWTTYTSGAYLHYLGRGAAAAAVTG